MKVGTDLLGKLYATAENQQRWAPLLDDLCAHLGAASAVVQLLDESPERLDVVWQARDTRSAANSALHDRCLNNPDNPRLQKSVIVGLSTAAAAELMILGSDRRLFGRVPSVLTEIQNRVAQIGLGHAFWVSFPVSERRRFSLILHREASDDRDLNEAEEGALRELLPHMQQSTRLQLSLESASRRSADLEHALDRLGLALVMCDTDLRIQWSNEAAEELLAHARHLRIAGGRLETLSAADMAKLRHMVSRVALGETDSTVGVVAAEQDDPIHMRVLRSPVIPSSAERSHVAVFLSRPNLITPPKPEDLGILYQLTPAEARLAAALAGGASLSSYSAQRGIAVGTARNQLKQVLSKTYTRSQSDLVRTVCNSAASRSKPLSH